MHKRTDTRTKIQKQLDALVERDGPDCHYCGKFLPPEQRNRDHLTPRSKGGTDDLDNLVIACGSCNSSKSTMDAQEWEEYKAAGFQSADNGKTARAPFTMLGYEHVAMGKEIGPTALMLYTYLDLRMGRNIGGWPSYKRIREDTGFSYATIKKALDALVAYGAVEVQKRRSRYGQQTSNCYIVHDLPHGQITETVTSTQITETVTRPTSETVIGQITETEEELDSLRELDSENKIHSGGWAEEVEGFDPPQAASITTQDPPSSDPPEEESAPPPKPPTSRKRNLHFEAVVQVCYGWTYETGQTCTGQPLTKTESGRSARAAKELKEIGASPEEILARGREAKRRGWQVTPQTLTNSWTDLGTSRPEAWVKGARQQAAQEMEPEALYQRLLRQGHMIPGHYLFDQRFPPGSEERARQMESLATYPDLAPVAHLWAR